MRITLMAEVQVDQATALGTLPERKGTVSKQQLHFCGVFDSIESFRARREETDEEAKERRDDEYFDEEFA